MDFVVKNKDDWEEVATYLLEQKDHQIFGFHGNLGAGKTSLIQVLCKKLGIQDEVTSPTYSIIQEYQSEKQLIYHMDLYRLESVEEMIDIGIEDYLNRKAYLFIEWPSLLFGALTDVSYVNISIQMNENQDRIVNIKEVD